MCNSDLPRPLLHPVSVSVHGTYESDWASELGFQTQIRSTCWVLYIFGQIPNKLGVGAGWKTNYLLFGEHRPHEFKTTSSSSSYQHSGLHFYSSPSSKKCRCHFWLFFLSCRMFLLWEIIRCFVSLAPLSDLDLLAFGLDVIFSIFNFGNLLVCNLSHRHKGAADCRTPRILGVRSKAGCPAFLPGAHIPILASYLVALKWCFFFFLSSSSWDCFLFDSRSQTHKLCLTPGAGGAAQLWHRWRRSDDDGTVLCFLLYTFVLLPVVRGRVGHMHTSVLWALDWDCAVTVFMEQIQRYSTKWQSALYCSSK